MSFSRGLVREWTVKSILTGLVTCTLGALCLLLVPQCHDHEAGQRGGGSGGATASKLDDFGAVPAFRLTGSDEMDFASSELKGRLWVAYFFFTSCTGICPPMTRGMKKLQDRTTDLETLRLVGFSCDPERDSPQKLRSYAKSHGADPKRWKFLTGPFDEIQKIATTAMRLGLEKANPDEAKAGKAEAVMHSSKFVLVDGKGRIRGYFDGLEDGGLRKLEAAIRALQKKQGADQ